MQAGKYRHVVACDRPVLNDAGEIESFAFAFDHRASIEPKRGSEGYTADQIIASAETLICMRWSPKSARIDATWRLRHQGAIYNISSIVSDGTGRRELEISCESGKNKG